MSTILVTGIAGFIGSHVADVLIEEGHNVIGIDDFSGGDVRNVNPQAVFIRGSYGDRQVLDAVFQEDISCVLHFGAYAPEVMSHHRKHFIWKNNVLDSVALLNKCINEGISRFLFSSSAAVYGKAPVPHTEGMVEKPMDTYGLAKLAFEKELELSREMFGLRYGIVRLYNVYGPRQSITDAARNVFGIWMNQVLRGKRPTIYGDGTQKRAFTYVSDVSNRCGNLINYRFLNTVVNFGSSEEVTLNEAFDAFRKAIGKPDLKARHLPQRHESTRVFCSTERAQREFGFNAKNFTPLSDGLKEMWKHYNGRDPVPLRYADEIEVMKNLPKAWKERSL